MTPRAGAARGGWALRAVLGLTAAGALLRLVNARRGAAIARDGLDFLGAAERVLAGDLRGVTLELHHPPGYPALLALAGGAVGRLDEAVAGAATALASAAVVPAAALLARAALRPAPAERVPPGDGGGPGPGARAEGGRPAAHPAQRGLGASAPGGAQPALGARPTGEAQTATVAARAATVAVWAALLAAASPLAVELGGEVLSDGPFLALLAWSLVALLAALEGVGPRAGALAAAAASALAGAAFLLRPEAALVVALGAAALALGPRPASARGPGRRARDLAWFLAPALALAAPFLVVIRAAPTLEGAAAGAWKLTRKRDLARYLEAATPGGLARAAAEQVRLGLAALGPGLPLAALGLGALALGGRAARRRPGSPGRDPGAPAAPGEGGLRVSPPARPEALEARHLDARGLDARDRGAGAAEAAGGGRSAPDARGARPAPAREPDAAGPGPRAAALLLLLALGWIAACAVVRTDRRFGAPLALFALPLAAAGAGVAAAAGARALRRRLRARDARATRPPAGAALGRSRALRAVRLALALALLGGGLHAAWRPRHGPKASYRDLGPRLRARGVDAVVAHDRRAAHYAGARHVPTLALPPVLRHDARALLDLARREVDRGVVAVVVVVDDEAGRATSAALAALLEATAGPAAARPLEARGARVHALDAFVVPPSGP